MAKPDLGAKRTCQSCGNKFYDLNRDPILCPNCGTVFEVAVVKARPSAEKKAPVETPKPAEAEKADDTEVAEEKADLVSLETADDEAEDTGAVVLDTDDDDDDEIKSDDEEDTFLEDDEEEDDDVADIIGDVKDEEER